ncbi:hypothetical protein [Streptomyces sp. SD31]
MRRRENRAPHGPEGGRRDLTTEAGETVTVLGHSPEWIHRDAVITD